MKQFFDRHSVLLPYILILAIGLVRVAVAHPYGFVPVYSVLVVFGASRPAREFAIPLLGLMGVDIYLTTHQYGFALNSSYGVTWLWYLVALLLGAAVVSKRISIGRGVGASVAAAAGFFVASNFMVWAEWGMYPKTWAGLGACYVAALPFFRNSVIAETVCSLVILASIHSYEVHAQTKRIEAVCS